MPSDRARSSAVTAVLAAALLGAASGLRSQIGMAAVVLGTPLDRLPRRLRSHAARVAVTVAAFGELAVDKYPKAPDRTAPPGLAARLVLGGVSGGLAARSHHVAVAPGAVAGAGVAAGTSFGGLALRRRLSQRFPPLIVALAEDGLALGLVSLAVRSLAPSS